MKAALTLLALLVVSSGYFVNESFAEISENQAFLLEGSGFAVTEEIIRISEIDLGLSSQDQRGSTINFLTEDGFITLDNDEFVISNLEGKFLREGKYIRINGNIESSTGFDTSISFFGRLVSESKDASVYGFTGRITTPDDTYKVIYTTKLSSLIKIDSVSEDTTESNEITLYILRGSSTQGIVPDQTVQGGGALVSEAASKQNPNDPLRLRYFSMDRISVEPGSTITIVNDDVVSHSVLSGKENSDRYIQYTADGRISTGEILPGESTTIKFDDSGFYRLYDPDYEWMGIVAYVFPASDSLTLGSFEDPKN
jgi:plastocyanin